MLETPWAEEWSQKRTMFSYGEEMSTDPLEAVLLKELVFLANPRRVLEIGMFVGYGAVAMLEGSPSVQVVSLEIDPYLKGWLASCLQDAVRAELQERHEVLLGPALDSIPKLTGQFDMVFVDANKAEYKAYVEGILERKLLSPGGVIVCDNILYNGYPYMSSHFDAQPARRHFGNAVQEFNQWVSDHADLEQVVLPVRDGISIIRRSSDAPRAARETASSQSLPPATSTSVAAAASKGGGAGGGDSSTYTGRFNGSEAKHASPAMAAMAKSGGDAAAAEADVSTLPTSTKWSVLSSRVEGLVAELSELVGKQDAYCVSQSRAEGKAMQAVRKKMLETPWAEEWSQKRTMFSYGEEMSTDPLEAVLL